MTTQIRYATLVPLGTITIGAASTTVLLSVNCGSLAGKTGGTFQDPPVPGTPFRQLILTNKGDGNAFLMPRGKTAAGNPEAILAYIPKGATLYIPNGQPFENGILPENFCIDGDAACVVYGCGLIS